MFNNIGEGYELFIKVFSSRVIIYIHQAEGLTESIGRPFFLCPADFVPRETARISYPHYQQVIHIFKSGCR